VVALALIAPAGAGAATVTLGSPLTANFVQATAGNVGTTAIVSGPNIASFVDGTVVSWRLDNFSGGPFRLRVLKLDSPTLATGDGTGPDFTPGPGISEQAVSVPIKKGEVVGFDNSLDGDRGAAVIPSAAYTSSGWTPPVPNGGNPATAIENVGAEFAYNATVRYCLVPNVLGKKVGAASQALTEAGCTLGKVTKKKVKKGKKGKKGKKKKGPQVVRTQSVAAGASLADQASVDVGTKLKPKKKKKKK
jgi:hypothetical protein